MSNKTVIGDSTLYLADCRELLPTLSVDCVVTDPPYGITSLEWDRPVTGWLGLILSRQLWCFGSMRFFLGQDFSPWSYAQEVVWEKHNGSGFHADRFKRVHEFAVHWYRGDWGSLYKMPPVTLDAMQRSVKRKKGRPPHMGDIDPTPYFSEDGGPRLMRSVIYAQSMHGKVVHPTQKPVEILTPLIEYSCPPGGTVLDPFGGSFSTGIASALTGRKFIGIEIDPARFDIGCRNLEDSLRQLRMFA